MGAAPSLPSVKPPLFPASPAGGNGERGGGGRRGGSVVRYSTASSGSLLLSSDDFDLQVQEGLMTSVQTLLHQRRKKESGREMMAAVDNLKRLCIDHYFQEEIEGAMACACMDLLHSDDLFEATLAFRLMREAEHDVSADEILRRFTGGGTGEFNLALSKDIRGLLSLHDLSHLSLGEESLYKAKEFTSKHLTTAAIAIRYLEPAGLARYVRQSLDHPYHMTLMQYKARHHLSYLQGLPSKRNTRAMEELAVAEFQLNKLLHQEEMQDIKRWWVDLGLPQDIPMARDQVLKWYMWPMTVLPGSSFSRYRVEMTKIISFIYIVDDIFDLAGTQEELSRCTDAIKIGQFCLTDSWLRPNGWRATMFLPLRIT